MLHEAAKVGMQSGGVSHGCHTRPQLGMQLLSEPDGL